jgi:subtilisin family serine protease
VGVAVVDSGINGQHRDLIRADGTRVVSTNCFHANPVATCDSDSSLSAGGHGTKVAGIIAAVNNSVDLVGVAPESTLYNVNVFADLVECLPGESFCATDDTLIDGVIWILMNHNTVSPPIQVVNVSLGRPGTPLDNIALGANFNELRLRGIVTAVAACNDPTLEVKDTIPAGYPTLMAIAGTTAALGSDDGSASCSIFPHVAADTASWFTTDGRFDPATEVGVTISAPGEDKEDIVKIAGKCVLQSVGLELLSKDGGLSRDAGTSYSSAHVAGVVALMKQQAAALGTTLFLPTARARIRSTANRLLDVPLDSTHASYTFDGEREGIVWAPGALQ